MISYNDAPEARELEFPRNRREMSWNFFIAEEVFSGGRDSWSWPCSMWADSRNSLRESWFCVDVALKRVPSYTFSEKLSRIAFVQIFLFLGLNYIAVRSFIF